MKRELGIARCGLACCLCSENVVCRPASMSLCGSSGSKEQLPKRFAEAENELQMGYALRRTGKLSSSVRVLKGALRKTGWIDADGKIASCENEACVQKATDLATKILASYGYTRALEATQTDPRNVNWGAYRDAVTSVRRSMETAKSNTDGCALAYHYAAMVEYLLAWEALTGKGIEVLNVSGRTSKELLEDSIEHENSCATTLVGKTPRVKALTLGTVTTMDHQCFGIATFICELDQRRKRPLFNRHGREKPEPDACAPRRRGLFHKSREQSHCRCQY